MIDALLEVTDTGRKGAFALAVTAGPGSFTGLRIVAWPPPRALAARCPFYRSVPTPLALKEGGIGVSRGGLSMMDARRGKSIPRFIGGVRRFCRAARPLTEVSIRRRNLTPPLRFPGDGAAVHRGGRQHSGDRAVLRRRNEISFGLPGWRWQGKAGRFVPEAQASIDHMRGIPGEAAAPWNLSGVSRPLGGRMVHGGYH